MRYWRPCVLCGVVRVSATRGNGWCGPIPGVLVAIQSAHAGPRLSQRIQKSDLPAPPPIPSWLERGMNRMYQCNTLHVSPAR